MRRIVVLSTASGCGKTTVGRELARRLDVAFVELDAMVHGPGWESTPDDELRDRVAELVSADGWVIDGSYSRVFGDSILEAADTVVWLDLPMRIWFPRLVRRSWRRWRTREELWNGNRETLRGLLWGREALFAWAIRSHVRRRREYPVRLARFRTVRLRTRREIDRFLTRAAPVYDR